MLKRHEIQVLRQAGHTLTEVATLSGVSIGTVRRVVDEAAVTTVDNDAERDRRQIGRPSKAEAYRELLLAALADDATLRTVELLHRARLAGYTGGKTALYALAQTLRGRSLIFTGKPGRGKTHLAVAIAYRAIQNGFDAYFTTAATLIDDLSAAFREGQLAQALPAYTHPAVLIVDEVGYLTYGTDAANMLFHVVNERHRRRRATIFTTNKSLKAWGRVLHDDDLAQAIIDRVLERGRLIRLDGPSVRTLHVNLDEAMKEESDSGSEVITISGNQCAEFPEPTGITSATPRGVVRKSW